MFSPLVSSVLWIMTWLYSLLLEAWPFRVFTTTAQWEARQVYLYRDKSADLKRKAFDCSSVQVRASSSLFLSNLCLIYICTGSISHLIVKSCPQIAIFVLFQFSYKLKTVSHLADVGVWIFMASKSKVDFGKGNTIQCCDTCVVVSCFAGVYKSREDLLYIWVSSIGVAVESVSTVKNWGLQMLNIIIFIFLL